MHSHKTDINDAAFSRSVLDAPLGKLMDEQKTKVDFDTGAAFRKIVHDAGTDTAGALRDYIYFVVHRKTFTDMQIDEAKAKRERLFCTVPIDVPLGARPSPTPRATQ